MKIFSVRWKADR